MLYDCFSTPEYHVPILSCHLPELLLLHVCRSIGLVTSRCFSPIICDERTPKIDGMCSHGVLTSDSLFLGYQGKQSKRQNSGPGVKGEYQAFSPDFTSSLIDAHIPSRKYTLYTTGKVDGATQWCTKCLFEDQDFARVYLCLFEFGKS